MEWKSAEDIRDVEVMRLSSMLEAIWPKAMRGDYRAIDRALRISERLSRLLGLDAAIKQELTGGDLILNISPLEDDGDKEKDAVS